MTDKPNSDILKAVAAGWTDVTDTQSDEFLARQIDKGAPEAMQSPIVSTWAAIRTLSVQIADLVQRLHQVGEENGKLKLRIVDAEKRAQNVVEATAELAEANRRMQSLIDANEYWKKKAEAAEAKLAKPRRKK